MSFRSWLLDKRTARGSLRTAPRTAPAAGLVTSRPVPSTRSAAFTLPDGPFRFVALDVETANSDSASICQIGLACVRHDGSIDVVSTLIDPEQPFAPFNVNLHGISPAMVRSAPKFPAVLRQIAPHLDQHLIIQHSPFDRRAINSACRAYGLPEQGWRWADSVQIARRAWPEFRGNGGHGLGHLKQALALDFEHHDAGEDAKAAAMVVLQAEARTGQTLDELISPPRKARRPAPSVDMDLLPHLERLTALVRVLAETRPIDIEDRRHTSRPLPAETTGPASDHDLGAQVEIMEAACRVYFQSGEIPAPYYAWRIAIILGKARQTDLERAFLAAWCGHFGGVSGRRYEDLAGRARKRGIAV